MKAKLFISGIFYKTLVIPPESDQVKIYYLAELPHYNCQIGDSYIEIKRKEFIFVQGMVPTRFVCNDPEATVLFKEQEHAKETAT